MGNLGSLNGSKSNATHKSLSMSFELFPNEINATAKQICPGFLSLLVHSLALKQVYWVEGTEFIFKASSEFHLGHLPLQSWGNSTAGCGARRISGLGTIWERKQQLGCSGVGTATCTTLGMPSFGPQLKTKGNGIKCTKLGLQRIFGKRIKCC